MLSNTATPKYYAAFREKVQSGELPVCYKILQQMDRIEKKIANPNFYYDPAPVEGFIKFCEKELVLTDGSPMLLTDSAKLHAEDIFGWYRYETRSFYEPWPDRPGGRYVKKRRKRRLCKKVALIEGRGAAKTMEASAVQAYGLVVDPETTHQFAVAYTMDQAEETLAPLKTAILKHPGPVFSFMSEGSLQNTTGSRALRPKLFSSKKGVENAMTGSLLETRPCSIDKLQGYRTKYNTLDEFKSTDMRANPVVALEAGAAKTGDYLIMLISSEGTVRNRIGDTIGQELETILRGDPNNPDRLVAPEWSIWWYRLDDEKEIGQPEMWIKANPNLGITVSYETYAQDVETAELNPAQRNEIIAKRFGIPLEGTTYFFTYEETLKHPPKTYWQMPCALGCDLSQGDDFCAFTFLFPLRDGTFGVKCRAYISERTQMKLSPGARDKYNEFVDEGTLIVMPGTVLDMMAVYEDLIEHITDCQYEVLCMGYDPYNAEKFVERWIQENGNFGNVFKVRQGKRTESVPLGELKQLAEDRALLFDEDLMMYAMGNAQIDVDINNNKMLCKRRNDEKIDPVSAMMDAYVAYTGYRDNFD
jgi:phage terminase large subunit-like protein